MLHEQRPDVEDVAIVAHQPLKNGSRSLSPPGGPTAHSYIGVIVELIPSLVRQITATSEYESECHMQAVQVRQSCLQRFVKQPRRLGMAPSQGDPRIEVSGCLLGLHQRVERVPRIDIDVTTVCQRDSN